MILSGPGSITFGSSSSVFRLLGIADLRIGVAQASQVGGPGPHVQVLEQAVVPRLRLHLRHAALGIVDVAEYNSLGGTSLSAGRRDFAIGNPAVLLLGLDFDNVDPLDAIGALLHHAAAADGDVGVAEAVQAGRAPIRIQQEVEAPYLVRAIVGAV